MSLSLQRRPTVGVWIHVRHGMRHATSQAAFGIGCCWHAWVLARREHGCVSMMCLCCDRCWVVWGINAMHVAPLFLSCGVHSDSPTGRATCHPLGAPHVLCQTRQACNQSMLGASHVVSLQRRPAVWVSKHGHPGDAPKGLHVQRSVRLAMACRPLVHCLAAWVRCLVMLPNGVCRAERTDVVCL